MTGSDLGVIIALGTIFLMGVAAFIFVWTTATPIKNRGEPLRLIDKEDAIPPKI